MAPVPPLSHAELCRGCGSFDPGFLTTDDLPELDGPAGQGRAVEALSFALDMRHPGYHVFVLGEEGVGRHEIVRRVLKERASHEEPGPDLCYVHGFADAWRPVALELPAGQGRALRTALASLVEDLRATLPATFESDETRTLKKAEEDAFHGQQEAMLAEVQAAGTAHHVSLVRTPSGVVLAPVEGEEVLPPDRFQALPPEEKAVREREMGEMHELMREKMRQMPKLEHAFRARMKAIEREITFQAVRREVDELRAAFPQPAVRAWLDALEADVVENAGRFLPQEEAPQPGIPGIGLGGEPKDPFRRYGINLVVDHAEQQGAPVIYEDNPTLANLLGRVEHRASFGALHTDFTLVRGGALHQANHGYLVLDAHKLLRQPLAWEELKRALRSGEIRITTPDRALGLVSTATLEPASVPLDLKVMLLVDRSLYYMLSALDPEVDRLFKVAADFDDDFDADAEGIRTYARLVATIVREEGLLPVTAQAVGRILRQANRHAEDARKLSANLLSLADLLREADHTARKAGHERIDMLDVEAALAAERRRNGRVQERVLEAMVRGTLVVPTDGEAIGQIIGLSVAELGRAVFGRPTRISVQVRLGRGQVVDIEREVSLGGPLHSKGVLILQGFVGSRFAQDRALAFQASIVFEQSYGGVEGDSASLAEAVALLSALGQVPLRQDIAVTGSIDQHGRVQAVGGVNEKIEGFFELCAARGLSGRQGAVLPRANVEHLVLSDEVLAAIEAGTFRIWAVESVDEALELLTGQDPGSLDPETGDWTEGSVAAQIADRLDLMAAVAAAIEGGARALILDDEDEPAEQAPVEAPPEPELPGPLVPEEP